MAKEEQAEKKKIPQHFYEPECPPTRGVYQWQVDEEGHHLFVQVGVENFDDKIQLHKDSCDIKILVDRLTHGDAETIARLSQPGVYGDVNNYPQEMHPYAMDDALKQLYENQPDSIKAKYPRYEDFKNYFLQLTDENLAAMSKAEADAKAKADAEKAANEQAVAQAALDAQAAAIAKALKESK